MIATTYFPIGSFKAENVLQESLLVSSTFLLIIIHKSYRHRRIKGNSTKAKSNGEWRKKTKLKREGKTQKFKLIIAVVQCCCCAVFICCFLHINYVSWNKTDNFSRGESREQIRARKTFFLSFDEFMTPEHDFHNNNKSFHATTYILFLFLAAVKNINQELIFLS